MSESDLRILDADVVIAVVDASVAEEETKSILSELEVSTVCITFGSYVRSVILNPLVQGGIALQEVAVTSMPVIVVRNKSDLTKGRSFANVASTSRLEVVDCLETCALTPEGSSKIVSSIAACALRPSISQTAIMVNIKACKG